jgi:hypothetical protein
LDDGELVSAGTVLGTEGNNSTLNLNVHLHYEYWACFAGIVANTVGNENFHGLTIQGSTCKKPPIVAYRPSNGVGTEVPPTIASVTWDYTGISVNVTVPREETDFHLISFEVLNGSSTVRKTSCMWNHCNAGNTSPGNAPNGTPNPIENDDPGFNTVPLEIQAPNWPENPVTALKEYTFKLQTTGYGSGFGHGNDQMCIRVRDSFGTMAQYESRYGACATTEEGSVVYRPMTLRATSVNPFHTHASYGFELKAGCRVEGSIYDQQGRRVATLVDSDMESGPHEVVWRGTSDDGARLPSGVYYVRVTAGEEQGVVKSVLIH